MKQVYFKSLMIADLQEHTARFQKFEKGLNVITSTDNHVGKSSLLKSLYYSLGAEVNFDSIWDIKSKLYIATISVDETDYLIVRRMKRFAVFKGDVLLQITDSVTKDLSQLFEEIFDFAVYLPNKQTQKVEIAPPAFTYMPYYIDQDKGWSGLYNSFQSMGQYKQEDRIKSLYYHLNIYTKKSVELLAERDQLKEKVEKLLTEKNRLTTILSALHEEANNLPPADNVKELEEHLEIPKEKIEQTVAQLGEARNEIQNLESMLSEHQHNLQAIKKHLPKTLAKTVHLNSNPNVCPNCGYTFDEDIFDLVRASYGTINEGYMCQQINLIIESVTQKLNVAKEKYVSLNQQLKEAEQAFQFEKNNFNIYVRQRGLADSIRKFQRQEREACADLQEIDQQIKGINKELRKLPNKKEIEQIYIKNTRLNIMKLDAWHPTYENNIHLLKPIKAQGSLETKIILSQVISLFQTMEHFNSRATRFPFVVDSPRAKEASSSSSKDILKMISNIKFLPQIILATVNYDEYRDEFATPSQIIVLIEKRKLLNFKDFVENQEIISAMESLLNNYQ